MLETIREFGLERLAASGEESATRSAHAAYYLALAEQAEPHLIASGSAAWVERLRSSGTTSHGRRLGLAHRQCSPVLRLAGTILSFAYARGEPREGQQWLEAALAAGSGASPARVDAPLHGIGARSGARRFYTIDRAERRGSRSGTGARLRLRTSPGTARARHHRRVAGRPRSRRRAL